MKAILILNGDIDLTFLSKSINQESNIYLCDGAYNKVSELALPVNAIIGDMDSIKKIDLDIPLIQIKEQNTTDFEKALIYLSNTYSAISIYGAEGGSPDHNLGNLMTGIKYKDILNLEFHNMHQVYFPITNYISKSNITGKTISIIPMPLIYIKKASGFLYDISNTTLDIPNMSIRNTAYSDIYLETDGDGYIFIDR